MLCAALPPRPFKPKRSYLNGREPEAFGKESPTEDTKGGVEMAVELIGCGVCGDTFAVNSLFRYHVLKAHPEWFWEEFDKQG